MTAVSITMSKFIAGVVIAILAASAISVGVSTMLIAGPQGPEGPQGEQGPQGPRGEQGETGPAGAAGATGPAGSAGAAGATGATGATGPQGPAGVNGATWLNGTGVPSASLGSNGDFYLNLANSDVYNKISGSWVWVANIRGATGATGPQGPVGPQGPPGSGIIYYNSSYPYSQYVNLTYGTIKNVCNITLTAPANGTVHLIATGFAACTGNYSGYSFGLGSTTSSYDYLSACGPYSDYLSSGTSSIMYFATTVQGTYNVTVGNTYTFYVLSHSWSAPTTPTKLHSIFVTATFYAK